MPLAAAGSKNKAMAAIHNSDLLARVLEYVCVPKEAAARKWLVSKAWLRAHDTPALWRTRALAAHGWSDRDGTGGGGGTVNHGRAGLEAVPAKAARDG